MAKKSFKDNPALQFISAVPDAPREQIPAAAPAVQPQKKAAPTVRRASLPDRGPGFEAKSKRLNLLIRPSLFHSLTRAAQEKGISTNDLIHQILDSSVRSGSIDNI